MKLPLFCVFLMLLGVVSIGFAQATSKTSTKPKAKIDPDRVMTLSCGMTTTTRQRNEEIRVEWRLAASSSEDTFYYNTRKMGCNKGVLKVWIKEVAKSTKSTADVSPYAIRRYELKCSSSEVRVVSSTAYGKNGDVLLSLPFPDAVWEEVIPGSIAEHILETVCHK
jgi:Surface-adhesin protein E